MSSLWVNLCVIGLFILFFLLLFCLFGVDVPRGTWDNVFLDRHNECSAWNILG